jgi:hypothetical protein
LIRILTASSIESCANRNRTREEGTTDPQAELPDAGRLGGAARSSRSKAKRSREREKRESHAEKRE